MTFYAKIAAFAVLVAAFAPCFAQAPASASGFEHVATYRALGGLVATAIAPGPKPGSQWVYASYLYDDLTFDVIAIDPANGNTVVFHDPVPGEYGARNLAVGPNGDVYFGTLPNAHFMRIDWATRRMVDLGEPAKGEQYIWDTTFGTNGKLYGVTYPGCKLVSYDPSTGKLADLGRMDPTEEYGRWIVAGHDGFLYMGIGTAKANIAVYDPRSGEMREVLPRDAQIVGTAKPYMGVDGKVYAEIGSRVFALAGFQIRELPAGQKVLPAHRHPLRDGRIVDLTTQEGTLILRNPKTARETKFQIGYEGEPQQLFRIGFGPRGKLYGSSILPMHLVRIDIEAHTAKTIGLLGGGELYSLLAHNGRLDVASYAGLAPLMSYDPSLPFHPSENGNPSFANYAGSDAHWRPRAMIEGPGGLLYVAGTAGYGQLEGPLVVWDGKSSQAQAYGPFIKNQSIISLTVWHKKIVGGTSTQGGGGSHPIAKNARVFLWNAATHKLEWQMVPVEGADRITDLITAPSGLVYGIAMSQSAKTLFALNVRKESIVATQALPFSDVPYNSVVKASDGTIWGLGDSGIFRIDDAAHRAVLVAHSPVTIEAGIALRGHDLYFLSYSKVYRYDVAKNHEN